MPEFAAGPLPTSADGAVIVPAHNEAAVIARTLRALAPLTAVEGMEVIVACNGCTDDTAEIAREFAGVQVIETDQASKTVAMNLGDDAATAWPRLYLDADIDADPHSVLAVFAALAQPGVLAARARYVYDAIGVSIPVRAYYRARSRIPAPPARLWGAGGYATTEKGHRRFGRFADVIADDSWFDEQFHASEKRVVATAPMRVRTPRNAADLVAVLARRRRGVLELGATDEASSRGRALLRSVRGPRSAIDAGWYTVLTLLARRRALRTWRQGHRGWDRDASSRANTEDIR
ncbi:glycosyltransferase [Ruania zhangjianzhongii]|uniref:glycosyltransferase n=1 Tax=Ruania zhangjianzhongii TaxID=2603206 RepID=UPI001F4596DE|nr:glycosyltransferase [Ruania zhangjianzhongii]